MIKLQALLEKKFYKSLIWGIAEKKNLKSVRTFCLFIGYPRSGHSFLGALLDAHPNIAISMEVDALDLLDKGYTRNQIYYCIVNNTRIFTQIHKNVWTGYSYAVPDSYQGKFENLLVIGDKKGGKSTLRLGENPELMKKLSEISGVPIKIFHVIRNPFDNITTMMLRYIKRGNEYNYEILKRKIILYFKKVEINHNLRNNSKLKILDIYHEDFIEAPEKILRQMLIFLDIKPIEGYVEKCTAIAYKSPHQSRHKIVWPEDLKNLVGHEISKYDFLKHYRFED